MRRRRAVLASRIPDVTPSIWHRSFRLVLRRFGFVRWGFSEGLDFGIWDFSSCPCLLQVLISTLLLAPGGASAQNTTNLLSNPGFEQNTTGWSGFGPVSFTATTAIAHSGSRSAWIQNRTDTWNGVAHSLLGVLQPNISYQISAWVRLSNSVSQPVL